MKFKLLTVVLMMVFAFSAFAENQYQPQTIDQNTAKSNVVLDEKQLPDISSDYKIVGDMQVKRNTGYDMPKATFLAEGFESGLPADWTLFTEGADWQITSAHVNSGDSAIYHNDDNIDAAAGDWLITPAIDLTGSVDARLTFFQYEYFPTYYDYHGVFVMTDTTGFAGDTTGLDLIYEGAGPGSTWEQVIADLSAYDGQTIYIGFYYFGDWADEWYLDDIVVEDAPVLPVMVTLLEELNAPPTPIGTTISDTFPIVINQGGGDLTISDVSSSSADLTLTPISTVIAPGDTMFAVGSFTPSVSGLISGEVIIQGDDPDNAADTIAVSGIGYSEADYVLDDVQNYPFTQYGWRAINNNADAYTWGWYADVLDEGDYAFGIRWGFPNDDYLVSPPIEIEAGDFIAFESWVYSASYPESWQVLVSTTDTEVSSFIYGLDTVSSNSLDPVQYMYDLSEFAGETVYIAIHNVSNNQYYQFVDNVLMPQPTYPPFGDLLGSVADYLEAPIEGAVVSLTVDEVLVTDTTDASGAFRIDSIASGTYDVTAAAEGFLPETVSVMIEDGMWTIQEFMLYPPMVDWCNLQWPYEITIDQGDYTGDIYGQVWEPGVTEGSGQGAGIVAELGIGAQGSDPMSDESWVWTAANYNASGPQDSNDEYMLSVIMDVPGDYSYCYRYSLDGGPWVYGDMDGSGNGLQIDQLGALTVNALAGTQKLLITEFVVTPTDGEFVEIYNPNDVEVDLSNYYLTDATYQSGGAYYYNIVTGTNAGGGGFYDFNARFPDGAMILPGEFQTVALAGDSAFYEVYGVLPTYELYEDSTDFAEDVVEMREALEGSIATPFNGSQPSGLTNSGEVVILYYWDGMSDLVKDVDYVPYEDTGEAVDKTGVEIDGPDDGEETSAYLADTEFGSQMPALANDYGYSVHRIDMMEGAQVMEGGNGITGADETSEDLVNTFTTWSIPSPNGAYIEPLPEGVILMEDFEDVVLPEGWMVSSNAAGWQFGDASTLSSTYWTIPEHTNFTAANDDAGGSGSDGSMDYLITPMLDMTGDMPYILEFQSFYDGAYSQLATVEVSEDGGATWTPVYALEAFDVWVPVVVDLSAYSGEGHDSVWVAFHADDAGAWASGWAVDDVVIRETGIGNIAGTVTVNATGDPVDSAMVYVGMEMTYTDESGNYAFNDLFEGYYPMMVYMDGYNLISVDSVQVLNAQTTVQDFALTAPTMEVDSAQVMVNADGADSILVPVTVSNNGDGMLEYMLAITPTDLKTTDYSKYINVGTPEAERVTEPVKRKAEAFVENLGGEKDPTVIHFDGDYDNNGIGTNSAVSFICAARFTADELADYYGTYGITQVHLVIHQDVFANVTVKIFEGGSPETGPGIEVYSHDITSDVLVADWTVHELAYPVPLHDGMDYWIGYSVDATGGYPAAVDAGPAVAGKGDWMYFGGEWIEISTAFGLNYNWNIRAMINNFSYDYWLSADPLAGMIEPGNYQMINLVMNSSMFVDSVLTANLNFVSNPDVGTVVVPVTLDVYNVGINDHDGQIPRKFALEQNYPNPFNPTTTINFQLPKASDVNIAIYNAMGQKVRTLVTGQMEAGYQHIVWDAKDDSGNMVPTGIYFYRMKAGDFNKSMKMLLLK